MKILTAAITLSGLFIGHFSFGQYFKTLEYSKPKTDQTKNISEKKNFHIKSKSSFN